MILSRDEFLARLAELGIRAETVEHPPLFTVEESRALRGEIPGAHTKNLFLKCKKGQIWLITALEDTEIDLKSLHQNIGSGRLSFGNAELMLQLLGVTPGAVTTFGIINDTENRVGVILDRKLFDFDRINLHPLVNTATTGIGSEDFVKFLNSCNHPPRIFDFEKREFVMSA